MQNALWELWIQIEACETLVQSKIKEICFEKAGLHLGGWLKDCDPSYRPINSSVHQRIQLQPHNGLGLHQHYVLRDLGGSQSPILQVIGPQSLVLAMEPEIAHEMALVPFSCCPVASEGKAAKLNLTADYEMALKLGSSPSWQQFMSNPASPGIQLQPLPSAPLYTLNHPILGTSPSQLGSGSSPAYPGT